MKGLWIVLTSSLLLGLLSPALAEISVKGNTLTIKVQDKPLSFILKELAHQGEFQITVFETMPSTQMVTEHFVELPIEEGLNRLFVHWNYGLTKTRKSGQIQKIFLVSQRIDSSKTSETSLPFSPVRSVEPRSKQPAYGDMITHVSPQDD